MKKTVTYCLKVILLDYLSDLLYLLAIKLELNCFTMRAFRLFCREKILLMKKLTCICKCFVEYLDRSSTSVSDSDNDEDNKSKRRRGDSSSEFGPTEETEKREETKKTTKPNKDTSFNRFIKSFSFT